MQKAQSKSTERASKILAAFSAERPLLRPGDLAALFDLHPTTVWRYLVALEEAHLVERDDRTGCYKLGLGILQLSSLVLRQMEVRQHSLEEMDTVRDEFGLLVNLGLLQDADVIHVAHAFPVGWPRWNMDLGGAAVAQCTALGKVLLAALPGDEAVQRVETVGWRPYTKNSIRDAKALREELRRVREQGYGVDREERRLGTMCVAVPVHSPSGEVIAAMSVSSRHKSVVDIGIDKLVDVLQTVSRRVSIRMGAADSHITYF
jgi:IclR family transcriptional regulator, KDG regulon repressor